MDKCIIRNETPDDYREVERLTRKAFWNVYRPGCLEHYVLHNFRTDPDFVKELDFVLEREGKIIGHVMFAHAKIQCDNGKRIPIMTFGPICIDPKFQRQGFGKKLLDFSTERAKELGAGALAICGNIAFYGKSGFVRGKEKGIRYADDPDADYFLVKELSKDFFAQVSGTFREPKGYFVSEAEAKEFDRQFSEASD